MAAASLVLGIISILLGVFGMGFQWLGAIFAIIGIILAACNHNPDRAGVATAGKVCSIIGLILCLALFLACVACVGGIASLA